MTDDAAAPEGDATAGDTDTDAPAPDPGLDLEAEVEKWKALARKHESQSRTAAKELERMRQEAMSESERAIAEAVAQARSATLLEVNGELVKSHIARIATGRMTDTAVEGLIAGIDVGRFLTDEGNVDQDGIREWVDKVAPAAPTVPTLGSIPDVGAGRRATSGAAAVDPITADILRAVGMTSRG